MESRWREDRWWVVSGLAAVAVAATPVVLVLINSPGDAMSRRVIAWWACVAGFVAAYLASVALERRRRYLVASLLIQTCLALAANWLIPIAIPGVALTGILLVVAAAGLAPLPRRVGAAWVLAQSLALGAIYAAHWPLVIALAAGVAYGAMQMVVFSAASLGRSEREKRIALESTLRELLSTRAMLEETVRSVERSEFARDLHDVVGHHLVALGLQLDAAIDSPSPREHLADARRLVRLLLADIREVVADVRHRTGVDLRASLQSLATDGPGPRVVVHVDDDAPELPSALAQTLLRCAQEAVTNARKHAAATAVRISMNADRLTIEDDGRGLSHGSGGVGLDLMRERCHAAGCAMRIEPRDPRGTALTIHLSQGAGA